jgi:Nif-specific regulatory protein
MSADNPSHWLAGHSHLAPRLCALAGDCDRVEAFLQTALPWCVSAARWKAVALVSADSGTWRTVAAAGEKLAPPSDLLSDALDRDGAARSGDWVAAPLGPRGRSTDVLAAQFLEPRDTAGASAIVELAGLLSPLLRLVQERERQRARVRRLETMLALAADWTKSLEMSDLFERIAAASTQLLDAERASIFLRDTPTRTLVGRPALGVTDGELRIPEDTGVVGQVVRTGEPRRVGGDDQRQEIDHSVDERTKFRTRSVLCVPLRGKHGAILGAFELLNKRHGDFTADDEAALVELAAHAAIALENSQQHEQLSRSRSQLASQAASRVQWIGESPRMQQLRQTVQRVAATDLAVLILGENGTGKEVAAQLIHYLSPRRDEPFVAVNCAALPETLLESELFGHERGAFTDARETRPGKFELASGGTLMLDEIGDMSPGGQAKLLRVLEEKIVVRLGGSTPIHTDARILAATNQNLAELVSQKRFRQDLFFRLTVVTLELPPLRERGDDIWLLAEHFLREFSAKARRSPPAFTPAARQRLRSHDWPGNVRELRNLMERIAYLSPTDQIDASELSFTLAPTQQSPSLVDGDLPLSDATREFQAAYIQRHIERARGNMTDAAECLGLHRSNLYRKMKQLDMATGDSDEI